MADYIQRLNQKRISTLYRYVNYLDNRLNTNQSANRQEDMNLLSAIKWALRLAERHLEIGAKNAEIQRTSSAHTGHAA